MKKFLPFEDYLLETDLSVQEVKSRIASKSQAKNSSLHISAQPSRKEYEGYMYGDSFTINRIISYRNSFLPIITGQLSRFENKTQVRIKMRPSPFVIVFMVFWLGVVGFGCILVIIGLILYLMGIVDNELSPLLLIPFVMFFFGYFITMLGFKTESKTSTQFLVKLLEGKEL